MIRATKRDGLQWPALEIKGVGSKPHRAPLDTNRIAKQAVRVAARRTL